MKALPPEIVQFFRRQPFVIVSTVDSDNTPHNSCKGIVDIDEKGTVYILDLYRKNTLANLKRNPNISITAVDEHKFVGYCLKGIAAIVDKKLLTPRIIKAWEKRLAGRITHRLLKNIKDESVKGHTRHPESLFPKPEYMISVKVSEIVSLTPSHIK
ncbi:MAG: pyridoxamine 5'-phosphate oxidase family protein [Candidatus Omnitrophica bacterium]|nr:pyridoxamine 5'-phosphate oxidase family protein [Candidatus Omnitrophota bacterium]MBU4488203.1 pyridoxamine 5'-phosphate oxidase family protein [Candidatus Omnitrophota bacterium]MCG2705394.1 pyridoxamine 5'-phosphate oxidase family protein [Candidatus Omnitrophota bacterium]